MTDPPLFFYIKHYMHDLSGPFSCEPLVYTHWCMFLTATSGREGGKGREEEGRGGNFFTGNNYKFSLFTSIARKPGHR